jgi:glycosyltransferase 2 family protein
MRSRIRKTVSFAFRWGIAVVGVWWMISHTSIADHALLVGADGHPQRVRVDAQLPGDQYRVADPDGHTFEVSQNELLNAPDRKTVAVDQNGVKRELPLLGMDLSTQEGASPVVQRLFVADSPSAPGRWILPVQVLGGFQLKVPYPKVEVGLETMVREANPWLLVLSVLVFPITIVLTSVRWQKLLHALEINLSLWRTFVLNMVGLFYNTFIPMGSSGGDLLKAYYAAQHTPYKTRAVLSVFVDRVIGLIVLIILGGAAATLYLAFTKDYDDPSIHACRQVAATAWAIVAGMVLFLLVAFHPRVKALLQSETVLSRLPMRNQIQGVFEVMGIYRQHPVLILWAMVMTVPVHLTVTVSALLAGKAFNLPLSSSYYFIVVPVTVLAGAIPISPQGVGVMEFVAFELTARQGATISQVIALTMSIRTVQILWNFTGGIFVITGHYRAPKDDSADLSVPAPGSV